MNFKKLKCENTDFESWINDNDNDEILRIEINDNNK